jgi:hypothetical protein
MLGELCGPFAILAHVRASGVLRRAPSRETSLLAVLRKHYGFVIRHSFPPYLRYIRRPTDGFFGAPRKRKFGLCFNKAVTAETNPGMHI